MVRAGDAGTGDGARGRGWSEGRRRSEDVRRGVRARGERTWYWEERKGKRFTFSPIQSFKGALFIKKNTFVKPPKNEKIKNTPIMAILGSGIGCKMIGE